MVLEVLLTAVFMLCLTSCIKELYPLPTSPNLKVIKILRDRKVLSASMSLSCLLIIIYFCFFSSMQVFAAERAFLWFAVCRLPTVGASPVAELGL